MQDGISQPVSRKEITRLEDGLYTYVARYCERVCGRRKRYRFWWWSAPALITDNGQGVRGRRKCHCLSWWSDAALCVRGMARVSKCLSMTFDGTTAEMALPFARTVVNWGVEPLLKYGNRSVVAASVPLI